MIEGWGGVTNVSFLLGAVNQVVALFGHLVGVSWAAHDELVELVLGWDVFQLGDGKLVKENKSPSRPKENPQAYLTSPHFTLPEVGKGLRQCWNW